MNRPVKILVVEDESIIAIDIKRLLVKLGHEVTSIATSGEQAVRKVAEERPDLVILDIKLPGSMDGIDAAKQIRARYRVPFLYLTAHSNEGLIERSKLTEPYGYLLKPFREKELQAAIEIAQYKYVMEKRLEEMITRLQQEIIERKQIENALRQAHTELESRVKERTAELSEANTQLIQEIVERKRVEKALRTGEQQYRFLIEHTTDGIGILQKEKWVFINAALASLFDSTLDEFMKKVPHELLHEDVKNVTHTQYEHDNSVLRSRHTFVVSEEGREVWVEGVCSQIQWEGQPGLLVSMRDITERKRREIALEQEREHFREENIRLRDTIKDRYRFGDMIGKSQVMQTLYEQVLKIAATNANVIITGESGSGKELIARTIHEMSDRRKKAFVPVNCAGVTESLFENEFFGHRKGAFTGAYKDQPGLFDAAHGGTLFLDEVAELSLTMQAKLLRAIEGSGHTPVGGRTVRHVDVRIIAATNKNPEEQMRKGLMREDFFYRIHVFKITAPSLRERREDIPLLVEHFLLQYDGKQQEELPRTILDALYTYNWPGNIRQLQNEVQHYVSTQRLKFAGMSDAKSHNENDVEHGDTDAALTLEEALEYYEKRFIAGVLDQYRGHRGHTAEKLGIDRRSLYRKMKKYGLLPSYHQE